MTRPLSIAIVSTAYPPEDGGGIGTYTQTLAAGLAALGQTVHVIAQSAADLEERRDGVEVHRLRGRHLPRLEPHVPGLAWSAQVAARLLRIARRSGLDVVEFPNWEGVGFVYTLAPRRARAAVVTRLHTPFFETLALDARGRPPRLGDRFTCWLEQTAVHRADRLTSSTVHHREMMARAYGLAEERVSIVPLGIPLPPPPAGDGAPRPPGPRTVLYVSRLEHRKGTLTLLEAIPRVLTACPETRFVLAGKDRPHAPGGKKFADHFREQHPAHLGQVEFRGFAPDEELARLYAGCDLFVVPSQYESFGLIFVEAMARGKPVIGCRAGGMNEVIADSETGYLIEVGDTDALVDRMVRLLGDDALRQQQGQAARRRAEERFSAARMAERSLELYRGLAR